MPEEKFVTRNDIIVMVSGLITLVVTTLLVLSPEMQPTVKLPLMGEMSISVIPTRRHWDVFVAPVWIMFLTRYCLDNRRDIFTALMPLLGLVMAGTIYLTDRNEVGITTWLFLPPIAALILGRLMNLLDDTEHVKHGKRATPFNVGAAVYSSMAFGIGMLLPFAVIHGFLLTSVIPLLGYTCVMFVLCTIVFGLLGLHRLVTRTAKGGSDD
ncbi:MAG: hypothetical protein U9Q03_02485 [Patescibacteria group bacterium]|nr:hypothetical protein [Patescibacteria group bacterium]